MENSAKIELTNSERKNTRFLSLFLFAVLFFDDFKIDKYSLNLSVKYPITDELVEFLLEQLIELTNLEFFVIKQFDSLDLHCLSEPAFFERIMTHVKNGKIIHNGT